MLLRPDMLSADSPEGIEVTQLTDEAEVPSCHIYMESQVFTPDSRFLVVHRSANPHGSDKDDPRHRYLLCDLEDECRLTPLTDETGVTGPCISPDGVFFYYFVNETEVGGGRLSLKRVKLDGTDRQTILVVDSPLPDTAFRPSRIYPLSTISADGQRIAISGFLGDGTDENIDWGLMVFDVEKATVALIIHGPTWCNMHPQYCRSTDCDSIHDILIQENHDNISDGMGTITRLVGGQGADIHVIRDDGTNFRNMPWGRDGNEFCQGHQCWRGRSTWGITSTGTLQPAEAQLIEGLSTAHSGHVGLNSPGGRRNDLSATFNKPDFHHFATDIAGERLVTDSGPRDAGGGLWLADLGEPGEEPLSNWTWLLCPGSSWGKDSHIHPFLSPDGSMAFFNSDESGVLQAYMVRGL